MIRTYSVTLSLFAAVMCCASNVVHADEAHYGVKCGTPEILRQIHSGVALKAARPETQHSVLSSEGHFRLHYDTTGFHAVDTADADLNGIPDYVDSALVYLEYSWDIEIDELGYEPPIPDEGLGGGNEIDFYIREFGNGGYGVTYPSSFVGNSASAYCVIDNDFAETQYATHGYEALKVTIAHEFFHTIHFRYCYDFSLTWWMEQSAVWMEDRVFDEVNDYLAYLKYFIGYWNGDQFISPARYNPINFNFGIFMYGACLWPKYLAKRFNDGIIRQIWEEMAASAEPGIDSFNAPIMQHSESELDVGTALNEFAVWNYFTKDRANPDDFHDESDLFTDRVESDHVWKYTPEAGDLDIEHLTSHYVELLFVGEWGNGDILITKVDPQDAGTYTGSVVFYNDPFDYSINRIAPGENRLNLTKQWDKAMIIATCTKTRNTSYTFRVWAEMEKGTVDVVNVPVAAFTLHGAYPNPFNPSTVLSFSLPRDGQVVVRAYNSAGQMADELFNSYLSAGDKQIMWKPSHLSTGIYYITVTTPGTMKTMKVMMVK